MNTHRLHGMAAFVLALALSVCSLRAQFTARGLTSKIKPAPAHSAPSTGASAGQAQPAAPRAPLVSPLIVAIDTNRNGIIEAGEIANASEALKKVDKNHDGRLTADEYLGAGESAASPVVKALDFNNDGVISESEISQASLSLRMLDKNGDGKLTPSEFRPVPAPAAKAK